MAGVYKHARGVLPPGTRIGRYELLRRLAKGGMAELYLARALGMHGFEKLVVLKLVLPHLAEDRQFSEMFLAEARLAATLDHPNIVHVTDIGEIAGEPFFVMEFVHGQDLRAILRAGAKKKTKVPMSVALSVVVGAATGLHYLHEKRGNDGKFLGLVHRDVSPSNVMLSYEGGVKLVDFGIAKATEIAQATRAGVLKGKVNYMAPEQCDGKPLDRRTDVFALGILLYESTTGRRLFFGDNDYHVMSRIVRGVFAKPSETIPDYPEALEAIVMKALSADPADRFPSALDLLREIESYAHDSRTSLSTLEVSGFLRELFGEQPLPTFDEAEDASPTALHPDARSAVRAVHPSSSPTVELPSETGVAEVRGLKPTGILDASPGATLGGDEGRPDQLTRVASGDVTPSRIATDIMDRTAVSHGQDRTVVAKNAMQSTLVAGPGGTEKNTAAVEPPSSPVPVQTMLPPLEPTDPELMMPPRRSTWIVVAAASVIGVVGILAMAAATEDSPSPVPASPEPTQTIPAAAVPSAAAPSSTEVRPAPIDAPAQPAVVPASEPFVPAGDVPVATPLGEPDATVADAEQIIGEPDPTQEGVEEVEPETPTESHKHRKKRRRGGHKSSTKSGTKKTSGGGLDAMYPGGGA